MLGKKYFFLLVLLLSFCNGTLFSQKPQSFVSPQNTFLTGLELYKTQKYGAAEAKFEQVVKAIPEKSNQLKTDAAFYNAVCAYELYHKDAEYKLQKFLNDYPQHTKSNLARFYLAKDAYRQRKYALSRRYFEEVNPRKLSVEEQYEFHFKSGYAAFKSKKTEAAKSHFSKISEKNTKYSTPAKYFHSHIAYEEGDLKTARKGFEDLQNDPGFSAIAPYYLLQINFMEEQLDDVINDGQDLYKNATEKRKPEIARVLAEAYYRNNMFAEALPFFEDYFNLIGSGASEEENYEMGYTLYKTGQFSEAIDYFQQATSGNDSISQYAYYHLAACYLNTGKKQFAQKAYQQAYEKDFDLEIKETSLFNYAQLAYELSFDPYSKAIVALQDYLKEYPNSSRNDEAYNFLFKIAVSTKKYDDALDALESIQRKDHEYDLNYQRILFYRGLELFNQYHYDDAIKMLKQAEEKNTDSKISALAQFWMAETFYRQENYWASVKYLNSFLNSKISSSLPEYPQAYYNLGYAHFKREEYNQAIDAFRQYSTLSDSPDTKMLADALLRIGDAYFMQKKYKQAKQYYSSAISNGSTESDYALYQKALISGLDFDNAGKINELIKIINDYPQSTFLTSAIYELGNTYLIQHDYQNALIQFKKVVEEHPNSSLALKSRLKTGLIYYNLGKNELALSTFENIVSDYPGSPESKEALVSIKNIYIETNKVDEYVGYVNELPFADVTVSEQDSLTFTVAENLYFEEKYDQASVSFAKYVEKFPEGTYLLKASYYEADCYRQTGKNDLALKAYQRIIEKPKSDFTIEALINAANIQMESGEYEQAYIQYYELENMAENMATVITARYGQLICNHEMQKSEALIQVADALLLMDKIDPRMRLTALMYKAEAMITLDKLNEAFNVFGQVIDLSGGAEAAEAKYNQAKIKYIQGDPETGEKLVFELVNEFSAYDYWVANSFILLADIYFQQNNLFQAKQTLQSIIDNYEGEDLKEIARQKYVAIEKTEAKFNTPAEELEMEEIDID